MDMQSSTDKPQTIPPGKLRSIADLGKMSEELRKKGEVVVLAHGTFDLLHIGHIKHLKAAASEGTVLIVTITADDYVIKGPGRPVFTEDLRAEMLASIEFVSWVGIHRDNSGQGVIKTIKPHVYVKGSEYESPEDDVTGQIEVEEKEVTSHGGRIAFTDEMTFSSSNLINRYLDIYDPPLQNYLANLRERGAEQALIESIQSISSKRVLLVGDAIVDEYIYAAPLGKSPKESMIATLYQDKEQFAGGVLATANHVASFCSEVEVITMLGQDESFEELIRASLKPNVRLTPFFREGAPTTRKTRFVEPSHFRKMFEVYNMIDRPIGGDLESDFLECITKSAAKCDFTLVNDFGHGFITPLISQGLQDSARFLAVNTQTNSANTGYNLINKYSRADYIAIDEVEARLAARDKFNGLDTEVIPRIKEMANCGNLIVTVGGQGCYAAGGETVHHIPAFTKSVVDTMGAGDAFFAITAPLVAMGLPMEFVGVAGNAAGALKVGIVGHRKSVEKANLLKYLVSIMK